MGGTLFFVWLAVAMTVALLALLALHNASAVLGYSARRGAAAGARGADAPHRRNRSGAVA